MDTQLKIRNFSSRVEKDFTCSMRSLVKYSLTREDKFIIPAPCGPAISSILFFVIVCVCSACCFFDVPRITVGRTNSPFSSAQFNGS